MDNLMPQMPMMPAIPQAQGNPSLNSLLQMIQAREAERPTAQQQQLALQQYMEAVRNAAPLNTNPWVSAGRGILAGPANRPWDAAAAEVVARDELARKDKYAREVLASKLGYEDVAESRKDMAGLSTGATTAMISAALDPYKNIPTVGAIEKGTGRLVLPANLQSAYNDRWNKNFDLAKERKTADPNAWATAQTNAEFARQTADPAVMGARAEPTRNIAGTGDENYLMQRITQLNWDAAQFKDNPVIIKSIEQQMAEAVRALSELRKTRGQPTTNVEIPAAGEPTLAAPMPGQPGGPAPEPARAARMPSPALTPAPAPGAAPVASAGTPSAPAFPATLPQRNIPVEKMKEQTAEVTGKALGVEHEDLNTASGAAQQLRSGLGYLRQLYSVPNMPQGAQGDLLQKVRSSLGTFGVEIGSEVGAADMARAISDKMAMLTRTADGKNLMPGPMSNFDVQILQGMVPSLNMNDEGRLAMIEYMDAMAAWRMRIAEEANKMAAKNDGYLPPEWRTRRDRMMKEELVRMKLLGDQIAAKFKGAK